MSRLTPESLAIWYMDDGSLTYADSDTYTPFIRIASNSFSVQENEMLTKLLNERFGVECNVRTCKGYPEVHMTRKGTQAFLKLVSPYIPECMKYKVTKEYRDEECWLFNGSIKKIDRLFPVSIERVENITRSKYSINKYTYDIEVADNHNFFANGILTHNCQAMPWILNRKDITFEAHEKVDGQSGTFFLRKYKKLFGLRTEYDFGVCSRNLRLFREDSSSYWSVVNRYHIRDVLRKLLDDCRDGSGWVCIQGECVAPNVQGNKYHVDKPDLYCFNLITEKRGKIDSLEAEEILRPYGLKWVPLVATDYILPDTIQEIEAYAHGDSQLYPTLREGIVFRNYEKGISFKCVDKIFLMKWSE